MGAAIAMQVGSGQCSILCSARSAPGQCSAGQTIDLSLESYGANVPSDLTDWTNPKLDTRISFVRSFVLRMCVTLRVPPLYSETGWTGELWSNPVLLILEN